MRYLILDTYYPRFLHRLYHDRPSLSVQSYDDQITAIMGLLFGMADFYSRNLKRLGQEAAEIIINNEHLQRQWAKENRPHIKANLSLSFLKWLNRKKEWLLAIAAAQIKVSQPDVLYIQDMNWVTDSFLKEVKPLVRLVIGQTAYALRPGINYRNYDLVVSSLPSYVHMFRDKGIPSEYLRIAFEQEVLKSLGMADKNYETVFIGGYTPEHQARISLLEGVAEKVPLDFWGYGTESLPTDSPIRRRYYGEAWGLDMYRVLAGSRIALNTHIDLAGPYAVNMRLYEATGVGTLLVTDHKENLHELFEPGKEVVVYRDAQECADLVGYYLEHEEERAAIARAGQERTLREHTYYHRMEELVATVEQHLRHPGRARGGVS